jgi:hypothetical protein
MEDAPTSWRARSNANTESRPIDRGMAIFLGQECNVLECPKSVRNRANAAGVCPAVVFTPRQKLATGGAAKNVSIIGHRQ